MNAGKILIVDDDVDQQRGLLLRLRASGYSVVVAGDAIQAISVARKELPDLILLDIGLPGGDGHLILDRLSALAATSEIPVIVLSGKDPSGHRERVLEAGAVAFFQKPVDNAVLLEAIAEARGTAGGNYRAA